MQTVRAPHLFIALSVLLWTPQIFAQALFQEGTHYEKLATPAAVEGADIVEFFYYGCKACYQLTGDMRNWRQKTGHRVAPVPAHAGGVQADGARFFHTYVALDAVQQLHYPTYVLFQVEQSETQGEARVNELLGTQNVSKDAFWRLWGSEEVSQAMAYSEHLTRQAQVIQTPTYVVHGYYKVKLDSLKSVDELFQLLEYLVEHKNPATKANSAPADA